jgi:putative cell wall-binding protein
LIKGCAYDGFDFPDALSLASASAAQGCPLLLVGNDYLPQSTARVLQTLAPRSLYIAGGENAVSSGLLNNLKEATGLTDDQIKRFAGEDRYATSTQILKSFFPGVQKIYLATGQAFPDALAGAALAANSNTPMLLVPLDGPLSGSSTENYLKTLTGSVELQVFGGQNAISDQGIIKIAYLLKP